MKCDIMLAGVGGQGVLSMAALIARAAAAEGLHVKQSEVHGMAQRGGEVSAHLRFADGPVASDLIPQGGADMILSMEPLESLRYTRYLAPGGALVTAAEPVQNFGNYPPLDELLAKVRAIPGAVLVEAERLARAAGDVLTMNTVMVGAAAARLPLRPESLVAAVHETFAAKGERVLQMNLAAFEAGRRAAA